MADTTTAWSRPETRTITDPLELAIAKLRFGHALGDDDRAALLGALLPAMPEVTQADREAAAKIYEWFNETSSSPAASAQTIQYIRDGACDGWNTVQAFRKHRLSASPDGLREALEFYADEERWIDFANDERASAFDRDFGSEFGSDRGERARAALAHQRGETK